LTRNLEFGTRGYKNSQTGQESELLDHHHGLSTQARRASPGPSKSIVKSMSCHQPMKHIIIFDIGENTGPGNESLER
jgi:hypothetical protein